MRIWSLHPKYLDTKGLVALWRETLLAKNVLEGKTKGYKNHPQLKRFKKAENPLLCINLYLVCVYREALHRGYHFDNAKINRNQGQEILSVTRGQMDYESKHLLNKLKLRDPNKYETQTKLSIFEPHPLFEVIPGELEDWEIVNTMGHRPKPTQYNTLKCLTQELESASPCG
jgi:hypothetical protein